MRLPRVAAPCFMITRCDHEAAFDRVDRGTRGPTDQNSPSAVRHPTRRGRTTAGLDTAASSHSRIPAEQDRQSKTGKRFTAHWECLHRGDLQREHDMAAATVALGILTLATIVLFADGAVHRLGELIRAWRDMPPR